MATGRNKAQVRETFDKVLEQQGQTAHRIAMAAVIKAGLPVAPDDGSSFPQVPAVVSFNETTSDVVLITQLNPIFTRAVINISLKLVSWEILRELELFLANGRARAELKVEETEVREVIFDKSVALVNDFIFHFPSVIYQSLFQSLNEALISHVKKFVDHDMREDWAEMGKPRKFSLLPNGKLSDLIRSFPDVDFQLIKFLEEKVDDLSEYRKTAASDRKAWLTDEQEEELPAAYERLRIRYKEAKQRRKREMEAHKLLNKGNISRWEEYWEGEVQTNFSDLTFARDLEHESPAFLARKQLADLYGFTPTYMEKKIRASKFRGRIGIPLKNTDKWLR